MEINEKVERVNAQYRQRGSSHSGPVNPSLLSFLKREPVKEWLLERISQGPWCELGCGDESILEDGFLVGLEQKQNIWGFDLSDVAIERARSTGRLNYEQRDITEGIPYGPYSFILDGHFLHCLNSLPEVFTVLGHILRALKPGGLYIGEVMTIHKNISFDSEFYFDFDQGVLYQGDHPVRTILEARQWEDLFRSCGFEIQYFVCQGSIKMIPAGKRGEPMSGDPECLRFVLKRPS